MIMLVLYVVQLQGRALCRFSEKCQVLSQNVLRHRCKHFQMYDISIKTNFCVPNTYGLKQKIDTFIKISLLDETNIRLPPSMKSKQHTPHSLTT